MHASPSCSWPHMCFLLCLRPRITVVVGGASKAVHGVENLNLQQLISLNQMNNCTGTARFSWLRSRARASSVQRTPARAGSDWPDPIRRFCRGLRWSLAPPPLLVVCICIPLQRRRRSIFFLSFFQLTPTDLRPWRCLIHFEFLSRYDWYIHTEYISLVNGHPLLVSGSPLFFELVLVFKKF
jgi:hypothetical protein